MNKAPAGKKQALRAFFLSQNAGAPAAAKRQGNAAKRATGPGPAKGQPRAARRAGIPNFLDPMCPMPAPRVVSYGKALPHTGLVSGDFVVDSTHTTVLIASHTGSSGTVGVLCQVDAQGHVVASSIETFTLPTLKDADANGGPSMSMAMKFSVSVTNCTNALKRGGRVTYLNSSQRLPALGTAAVNNDDYTEVIKGIKTSPYRRRITGDMLGHPAQIIGYPVDDLFYNLFNPHRGTLTAEQFYSYVCGASPTLNPSNRPMSIVAFVFDPVTDHQDYSLTIRASSYTRWPLTSVPGHHMRPIPASDAKVINHVHSVAESTGNDLAHIVEGGVMATAAPKVMGAARAAAGRAVAAMTQAPAAAAAEGVAAEAAGGEAAALLGEGALALALAPFGL